jgi:hypothetical protein
MHRENEEFFSQEQWLAALQRLRTHVEAAAPKLRARGRKAAMRLKERIPKPDITGDTLAVGLKTRSQLDHLRIPNRTMVADRTDGGAITESAFSRNPSKRGKGRDKGKETDSVAVTTTNKLPAFEADEEFLAYLEW